jgi:two-component system heavy metal sensor histidine kinase CusS
VEQHARLRHAAEDGVPEPILLVIGQQGEVVHQSADWPEGLSRSRFPAGAKAMRELPEFPRPPDEPVNDSEAPAREETPLYGPGYSTHRSERGPWRMLTVASNEATIVLGVSLIPHARYMARVALGFAVVLPVALLVIAGGSWWLARRAMRPMETLTETAEQITARGLDQRIPVESEDVEFRRLITVFNDMIARLERSFNQATRFSADAAHELRTPLTIMRGELEQAIQSAELGSQEQRRYRSLLEEVQRLQAIMRKLLLLSQADAGRMPIAPEWIDLTTLAGFL